MQIRKSLVVASLMTAAVTSIAQMKRTSIPIGDAVQKALLSNALMTEGRPFHVLLTVSEPQNPQSPYQGSIEEWWVSPDQWRREVTAQGGLHQTIVVIAGQKTETDEGDYYPLWLRHFEMALLDPIPNASAWTQTGTTIDQTIFPNGARTQACARGKSPVGTGERASVTFSNLCFDDSGRIEFIGSPRYSMEFHDYKSFGKKQIARRLIANPEPGTTLVGVVAKLEDQAKSAAASDLFHPLAQNDDRFRTVAVSAQQLEKLTAATPPIIWPPVDHGSGRGHLAMYLSVDVEGSVREAWPLSSDDAGLEDPARDQVRKWKLTPARDSSGHAVQVDGPISFAFVTSVGPPPPHLSNAEMRALATKIVEPEWPQAAGQSSQTIEVEVSVDEQGKFTGVGFKQASAAVQMAIIDALRQWTFRPFVRDGKSLYVHGTVAFTIP